MLIASESLWLAQTNCYLIAAERGGHGSGGGRPTRSRRHREPWRHSTELTVVALLVTHGHVDHAGGAGAVNRATGAAVYVHRDDDFLTLDPDTQLRSLFGMIPPGDYAPPEKVTDLHHGESSTWRESTWRSGILPAIPRGTAASTSPRRGS